MISLISPWARSMAESKASVAIWPEAKLIFQLERDGSDSGSCHGLDESSVDGEAKCFALQ